MMISHLPELHQAIMAFFSHCYHDPKQTQALLEEHQLTNRIYYAEDGRCIFVLEGLFDAVQHFCQLDQEYSFNDFQQCLYKNPTNTLLSDQGLFVDVCDSHQLNADRCYQLLKRNDSNA